MTPTRRRGRDHGRTGAAARGTRTSRRNRRGRPARWEGPPADAAVSRRRRPAFLSRCERCLVQSSPPPFSCSPPPPAAVPPEPLVPVPTGPPPPPEPPPALPLDPVFTGACPPPPLEP